MAAEVSKPDFSFQWSSGGSIVAPSNVKIQTGWTAEVPPFQWENWSQNRQDNAILHLFQKGVSVWSATDNYYFTINGERSYVQGSNGQIYVAVASSLNQNPVTDTSNTYWRLAFSPPKGIARFTANGSFTVPSGVTQIWVSGCAAGGGGGGGGSNNTGNAAGSGGSGGGAGQSTIREPFTVTPGAVLAITIGSAGSGGSGGVQGSNNATAGTSGGNTIVGTLITLTGGSAGLAGTQGSASTAPGPAGGPGFPAGGDASDGSSPTASTGLGWAGVSGAGGSSKFGGGGQASRAAVGNPGKPGDGFGSGGGGGSGFYNAGGPGRGGGAGTGGFVLIEY